MRVHVWRIVEAAEPVRISLESVFLLSMTLASFILEICSVSLVRTWNLDDRRKDTQTCSGAVI